MTSLIDLAKQAFGLVNPINAEAKRLVDEYLSQTQGDNYWHVRPRDCEAGRRLMDMQPETQIAVVHHLMTRVKPGVKFDETVRLDRLRTQLFARHLPYSQADIERLLQAVKEEAASYSGGCAGGVLRHVERLQQEIPLTPAMRASLETVHQATWSRTTQQRKLKAKAAALLGLSGSNQPDSGEAWSDAARAKLQASGPQAQAAWTALLAHAATADAGKPSAKWLREAEQHWQAVGEVKFRQCVTAWMNLAAPPPPLEAIAPKPPDHEQPDARATWVDALQEYQSCVLQYLNGISEKNIAILKGLAWYAAAFGDAELARALGHMAAAAFENVRERGAWAKSAGNAAIWALGQMSGGVGVGPLARLRTRLRDRGALKLIASAVEAAAAKSGMSVDELEDLAVPTGGLDADGARRETFGEDGAATLTLDAKNAKTNLQWLGPDGKPRKAAPAAVKKNFPAEVKALKAAEDEIRQALSAQAARFDKFLLDERAWPLSVWRERYLSHPILGNLARRLIWVVDGVPALPDDLPLPFAKGAAGRGSEVEEPTVKLWHPLGASPDDVLHWRAMLESRGIVQPFKQAHREVYLLTDAERGTRSYSNRFAAHVLKQHQFNSLCALRGWKNSLRLMVDDEYPPATRDLPQHGLRAEFWVEGIGDDYGTDTNDAGTYLRLVTDQVRFYLRDAPANSAHAGGGGYRAGWRNPVPAEPLPLEEVPPLVFSEVMRDIDLFVGVASLGNDPAWADGGPQGRFRDYWQDYAFGDLTETAKTRAEALARLLPRLKIAPRCRLDGKFLLVRGDLRTYKIHLGSGNILMEPNDQYLCIVPGRDAEDGGDLFLPFEGDRTLAVILSKAFLLAADAKIADPTITRQIGGKIAA